MAAFTKNYLHLHFIVLVWGFSGVLGKLISIQALPLVWYRMGIAAALLIAFMLIKNINFKVARKSWPQLIVAGILLALHWITFFGAIKWSNVSVVLATMSTGALFGALLEPFWCRKKIALYEVILGLVAVLGLYIIVNVEKEYLNGILLGLFSAFLAALFTIVNGQLVKSERSTLISMYEIVIGLLLLSVILAVQQKFTISFFALSIKDGIYILILAAACTAYAFTVSVKVMRYISAYTVLLTINLEPIYGILLALAVFGESENMGPMFYLGAAIILTTVILNGVLQKRMEKLDAPIN